MFNILNGKRTERKTREHLNGVFDEARHILASMAHDAQATSEQWAGKVKERGVDLIDDAQDRGELAWKGAKGWISREPGRALSAAFILGAIVTTLLRRKND